MLAAVLLFLPAGTSLALCLSGDSGTHGGASNDAPASTATVVVSSSGHHCPGEAVDVDTDPALQSETRTVPRALNDVPVEGSALAISSTPAFSRSSVQSRAPPPRPPSTLGVHISLRSTVLLV